MAYHLLIINLAQEDLVVGLGVLVQFQLAGHLVGQFAEAADSLALAQNIGCHPRMQVRHILCPLHIKGQAQRFRERLNGSLHREEVFLIAEGGKSQMHALVRRLPVLPGKIDAAEFEDPALIVAFLEVLHHDVHQTRSQQRPHDGKVYGNRVPDPQHIALRCIRGNPQEVQIAVRIEGQRADLMVALPAHDPADPLPALPGRRFPAVGNRGGLQEGRGHMVIAVFADDFLRQVRLADFNVFAVPGRGHVQRIAVPFHVKVQVLQNPEHFFRGNLDAEDRIDPLQARGEVLSFPRRPRAAVKGAGGDLAAAQFLDQVKGPGHAQLRGVFADALLEPGGRVAALAQGAGSLPDIVPGKLGRLKQ